MARGGVQLVNFYVHVGLIPVQNYSCALKMKRMGCRCVTSKGEGRFVLILPLILTSVKKNPLISKYCLQNLFLNTWISHFWGSQNSYFWEVIVLEKL